MGFLIYCALLYIAWLLAAYCGPIGMAFAILIAIIVMQSDFKELNFFKKDKDQDEEENFILED